MGTVGKCSALGPNVLDLPDHLMNFAFDADAMSWVSSCKRDAMLLHTSWCGGKQFRRIWNEAFVSWHYRDCSLSVHSSEQRTVVSRV